MTAIIQILISISINGEKFINFGFQRNYFMFMYLLPLIFKVDITF